MTRRTAILVGLLCLVGATALGARAVFFTGAQNPAVVRQGAFVLVAQGQAEGDAWSMRLYTREDELCRALVVVAKAESSRCASTPGAGAMSVTSVASARRRYVFGIAGGRVARIVVRVGTSVRTVETRTLGNAQARAAGISTSTRYFLAILGRPAGRREPAAIVMGLNAANRRIGIAHLLNCSQEVETSTCGP